MTHEVATTTRRGVTVFKENPFIDRTLQELQTKTQRYTVATGTKFKDVQTGENEVLTTYMQTREVEANRFVRIYTDQMRAWFELGNAAYKVLMIAMTVLQEKPNNDIIILSFEDIAEKLEELRPPVKLSRTTFHRGLTELLEKDFLARSTAANAFYVNPLFMFNGNRARFVTEYVVKRDGLKKRTTAEELEAAGQERLGFDDQDETKN